VLKADTAASRAKRANVDHVLESARALVEAQPDKVLNLAFRTNNFLLLRTWLFCFGVLDFSVTHPLLRARQG
jgi:hypothetical protein